MSVKVESVFLAKGIAIILVVIGHYTPAKIPPYWTEMRDIIYTFHMPLFFLLAGYLYGFSPPTPSGYLKFIQKKIKRLLIPFVSISAIFFIVKILTGMFFKLQFPVNLHSFLSIFISPLDSFLPLLWFIYTLFFIFAIYPLLCFLVKNNLMILMILVVLMYFYGYRTREFCLVQLFNNLPAFTVGFAMAYLKINLDEIRSRYLWIIFPVVVSLFVMTYHFKDVSANSKINLGVDLLLYIYGAIACISLSILINLTNHSISNYLKIVGIYSMSIYLLHTMFASMVRIVFYQVLKIPNSDFLYGALLGIILGIMLPLLIEKYILRRYQVTKSLFLGLW